jgi:hypothetical protein
MAQGQGLGSALVCNSGMDQIIHSKQIVRTTRQTRPRTRSSVACLQHVVYIRRRWSHHANLFLSLSFSGIHLGGVGSACLKPTHRFENATLEEPRYKSALYCLRRLLSDCAFYIKSSGLDYGRAHVLSDGVAIDNGSTR